jgi:hypothetical protein
VWKLEAYRKTQEQNKQHKYVHNESDFSPQGSLISIVIAGILIFSHLSCQLYACYFSFQHDLSFYSLHFNELLFEVFVRFIKLFFYGQYAIVARCLDFWFWLLPFWACPCHSLAFTVFSISFICYWEFVPLGSKHRESFCFACCFILDYIGA